MLVAGCRQHPEFEPDLARPNVSIFDLLNAVNAVLKRITQREDLRDIFEDKWTVSEKIEFLLKMIQEQASVKFSALFANASSRSEVVVTFLALLELIRLRQIVAVQAEDFGDIQIEKAPVSVATANAAAEMEPTAVK